MASRRLRIIIQVVLFGISLGGCAIGIAICDRFGWDVILTWNSLGIVGSLLFALSSAASLSCFGALHDTVRFGKLGKSFRRGACFVSVFGVSVWALCAIPVVAFNGTVSHLFVLSLVVVSLNGAYGDLVWLLSSNEKRNPRTSKTSAEKDDTC